MTTAYHRRYLLLGLLWFGLSLISGSAGTVAAQAPACDPTTYGQELLAYAQEHNNPAQEQHPLVLVHGFNSSASMWGDENDPHSLYGRLIQKYDPSLVHRLSYPPGPNGQPDGEADVTCTARYLMEAVNVLSQVDRQRGGSGQVDIVAHSLGGLVTRQLLAYRHNAGPRQTQYQGNIGRFIDLATPHSGSEYINLYNQGADAVAEQLTRAVPNKMAKPVIRSFIKEFVSASTDMISLLPDPESPAGQQLDPNSEFIKTLNQRPNPNDIDYYLLYSDIGMNVATKFFDMPVASGQVLSVGDWVVSKDNATTIPNLGGRSGPNPPYYQPFGFDAEITLHYQAVLLKPEIKLDNLDQMLPLAGALFHTNIHQKEEVRQKILELLENEYVAVNQPPVVTPPTVPPPVIEPEPVIDIQPVDGGHTATALVFDVSGSMEEPEPGGARKIEAAITAGHDILNLIDTENTLAPGAHQVGVVSFSNRAKINLPLSHNPDDARRMMGQLSPLDQTNMAAGLDRGIDILENAPSGAARILLLLSDGQPTTSDANPQPPFIFDELEYVDDLKDEILNQQVPRAKAANICIFTIGFGRPAPLGASGALDESFLQQIAAGSGCGRYYNAKNAFELSTVYLQSRHQALGKLITQYSGQIKQNETVNLNGFQVAGGAQQLTVSLNWPGSQLALQLIDPRGQPVEANYPNSVRREFGNLVYLVIQRPPAGQWQLSVTGMQVPSGVTDFNVLVSTRTLKTASGFNPLYLLTGVAVLGGLVLLLLYRQPRRTAAIRPPAQLPGVEAPGIGLVGFANNLITIGRHPRDHVVLPGANVSRHHARIQRVGREYILEDLNSVNGTLVNGQRVNRYSLNHGDQITIGDTTIIFRIN
ncbi:MAG: alpha/beta fold hydrolase [Anaerolineae bacterium]|nr:alpha/beta fold hydrolase [Anaerolineae bacterium]